MLINVFCVHVVIDCGGLPSPDNGEVDFSRTTFGAMAFYQAQQDRMDVIYNLASSLGSMFISLGMRLQIISSIIYM